MDTKGGWSVGAAGPVQQPDCVGVHGVKEEGGRAGTALALTQIVLNSSALYILCYSVIYNYVTIGRI